MERIIAQPSDQEWIHSVMMTCDVTSAFHNVLFHYADILRATYPKSTLLSSIWSYRLGGHIRRTTIG